MELYFIRSNGERISLGVFNTSENATAKMQEVMDAVGYKAPYWRGWREDNGTMFDVGSHSEFFYLKD